MDIQELMEIQPYSYDKETKVKILTPMLKELTVHHRERCESYGKLVKDFDMSKVNHYDQLPFFPVRLFKERELKSIRTEEIFKTMTSSGTTGQAVSKIIMDKETSKLTQKALVKIVSSFTQDKRMPMLVIDSPSVIKDRKQFSARGAGILGFSIFGRTTTYALKDNMEVDEEAILAFLEKNEGKKKFLFGFTFMIWEHLYKYLRDNKKTFDFEDAVLIHGGGWKKLVNEQVDGAKYKSELKKYMNITHVYDYYGMVEQTGCVYMECEKGHLHASIFSDIIIRDHKTFDTLPHGEKGIIQVVSVLPKSYPGHSLLTEDEGVILGEDDCPCGRKGKYFEILGRIKSAEIRGCSDTYEK